MLFPLLPTLYGGAVMADRTSCQRPEHGMMAGKMTGYAAHGRAFETARRLGTRGAHQGSRDRRG
ncbi:hypothetical protein [Lichenifustis flavocetrariae]|uniref:hypothetical protein n=1 Tax=Lichenifustis flavocetrariae TaxID=2949735 RepID=UPI0031F4BFE2